MTTYRRIRLFRWIVAIATLAVLPLGAKSEVKLIAVGSLPGDSEDRSGLKDILSGDTPHNRLGGQGSAIAYTGVGNRYVLVPDRGPGDGGAVYKDRFHVMDIAVTTGPSANMKIQLVQTTLLHNEEGKNFVGAATAFDPLDPAKSLRLDPEGARIGRDGNLFIADEYGPFLWEFGMDGKRIRSLKVPDKFLIARPSKKGKEELPPNNKSGRQSNKSMEGLAISPDGGKLFGLMQCPLIQDGALDADNKRIGVNNRLLEVDIGTDKTREFVYPLEHAKTGVCEILAINGHEFLVLERDGEAGDKARDKKIFQIDLAGATDVSDVATLPTKKLPASIKPVKKKLFIDLMSPKFNLTGSRLPQKIEGMAFGPDLPDGRRLLIITSDNDFIAKEPSYIYAFAIDAADLPGYQAQQFDRKEAPKRK